ncbi:hypothetical protein [Haloquadratum walsbyi]|nr:hypothetical protein [Haloquadratum walsbyi]
MGTYTRRTAILLIIAGVGAAAFDSDAFRNIEADRPSVIFTESDDNIL